MPDYLPRQDAKLAAWAANFVALVTAHPDKHLLAAEQVDELTVLHQAFADALAVATSPNTRTRPVVEAKNAARAALVKHLRGAKPAAADVKRDDAFRIALNCKRPAGGRRRVTPVPVVGPGVYLKTVRGGTVRVRVYDRVVTAIRRPYGTCGTILYGYVGDVPSDDLDAWTVFGTSSNRVREVTFDPSLPQGTRVWVRARWLSPTMQMSEPSPPVGTWTIHPWVNAA